MIQTKHKIKDQTGNVAKPLLTADVGKALLKAVEIGIFEFNYRFSETDG